VVRPVLRERIRDALYPEDQLIEVHSCRDLEAIARYRKIDVVVIDPGASRAREVASAIEFARSFPMIPILVYTVASPVTVRALISLRELGVNRALLYPFDESTAIIREELLGSRRDHLVSEFLELLSGSLKLVPVPLRAAILRMFENPALFATASDLGLAAGLPQSGVYRWFEAAGFEPPKRMFIAARILSAFSQFNDSRLSVEQVSRKLGYSNPRILGIHACLTLQVRPSQLRFITKTDLLNKLRLWVTLPKTARERPIARTGIPGRRQSLR
jgi:AraC-like DNA-binding protein